MAQIVLEEMYRTGGDPSQIIEEKGLIQVNDENELVVVIQEIIDKNEKSVQDYKGGKDNALQFLIGQVMKMTKGRANPEMAKKLLEEKIK